MSERRPGVRAATCLPLRRARRQLHRRHRVQPPARRWPDRLAAGLRQHNPSTRLPQPRGGGSDQRSRCSTSSPEAIELEPDLVTVVCGANDVLTSTRPDAAAYARRLGGDLRAPAAREPGGPRSHRHLARALGLPPARAAHAGAGGGRHPPRQPCHAGRRRRLPRFPTSRSPAIRGSASAENFSADGLHPSPLGHRRAARGFGELVRDRCRDPRSQRSKEERHERAVAGRAREPELTTRGPDDHRGRPGLVLRR